MDACFGVKSDRKAVKIVTIMLHDMLVALLSYEISGYNREKV